MATEKKPSIYDDRGTIGSSDELDEYGVWVKSEPQDLSSSQPGNQELIEPSIPDIEELPDFDTGFEAETGNTSENLSFDDVIEDDTSGDSHNDSFEFIDEELTIPDMTISEDSPGNTEDSVFDEVSLDDIMAPDNDKTEKISASPDSRDKQDGAKALKEEADFTEISIDDISQPDVNPESQASRPEEFSDVSMDEFTGVSMDELTDVSVDDFMDSEASNSGDTAPEPDIGAPKAEKEKPEQGSSPAAGSYGDIHSMVTSASDDEIFMSDFDDVEAVSQDIQRSQRTPKSEEPDLSTQLLMKIAEELASIKGELSGLKNELSVIRGEESAEAAPEEQSGGRGFFDEEDDEKIALTGDELDNILNTADFTEEAGADAGESLTDDFNVPMEDEDFSPEPFPELEDTSLDLPGGLPEETPDMLSDQPDIIGSEAPAEKADSDIPAETDQEDGFRPEDVESGESREAAVFDEGIVLNDPELDELNGEHSIDISADVMIENDSFDSQEFDVSFEPTLEEETDELASSDAVIEEDTGPQESDFEDVNVDDITLDKDVISLDFIEDDLSDVNEEIGSDELLKTKDTEELEILRTEGAKPMTEAPEDTTYLEEDPLAAEQLDLSGAVIDEPDLSGHITENPVQEPSLENISIDLDLEDLEDTPGDEPSFEIMTEDTEDMEIPLQNGEEIPETGGGEDFPADISFEDISESEELKPEEESFAQVIPEGFVVEPDDSQSAPPFDTVDTTEALREEDLDILEGDTGIAEFPPESPAEEKEIKAADEKAADSVEISGIPSSIKNELKTVLSYMDQLLESLPEEKIEEFAKSEYFETYKKLFEELGLV